jgi:hypothetical protein
MSHYTNEREFHAVLGKIIQGAGAKKGLALSHYYDKYSSPSLPPIWLVCEIFAHIRIDCGTTK